MDQPRGGYSLVGYTSVLAGNRRASPEWYRFGNQPSFRSFRHLPNKENIVGNGEYGNPATDNPYLCNAGYFPLQCIRDTPFAAMGNHYRCAIYRHYHSGHILHANPETFPPVGR